VELRGLEPQADSALTCTNYSKGFVMNWNSLKDNGAKLMNLAHRPVLTPSGNRLLAQPFGMPLSSSTPRDASRGCLGPAT